MEKNKIAESTWNWIFYKNAEQFCDKTAVMESRQKITYGQLNEESNRLAWLLRNAGITNNKRVAVMINNSIEAVVSILAVLKAGGAYVPVNPKDALERKKKILEDSGCEILITNWKNQETGLSLPNIIIYEEIHKNLPSDNLEDINTKDDYAYLLYTSGSTGNPKGAIITHHNIMVQMDSITMHYGFTSKDVWTQFHTICFDFSVLEIFGCLFSGGTLVIVPEDSKYNSTRLMEFIKEYQITVLGLVPSVLYRIPINEVREEKSESSRLKVHTLILGGEKLSFSKLKGWFEVLPDIQIINGYGLTETTIFNMGKTITKDSADSEISNIGQAFPPNLVYLIGENGLCGTGETGEICIGGPTISVGYWNNKELNKEKYGYLPGAKQPEEKIFRTGDLGRLLNNGDIEFIGRKDNQVKIRGFRVEIEEIENKLRLCELVRDLAIKIPKENPQVLCFVVFKDAVAIKALREFAIQNLPAYMIPSRWIALKELPLTERGKVDKSKLTVLEREGFYEEYVSCKTDIEWNIQKLWKDDFQKEEIGAKDSYYELGGNSLSVINMLEEVGKQYKVDISLIDFMEEPTILALGKLVEQAIQKSSAKEHHTEQPVPELVYGKHKSMFPMTDLQQAFFIGRQTDVDLGNCASHSYAEILCSDFEEEKFIRVIGKLVNRHAMLRCWFDELGNHHIEPTISYHIPVHDVSEKTEEVRRAAIEEVRNRMENVILDYTKAPLVRVEVSRISKSEAIIHLYMDALISDGWSHELLLYEADFLYDNEEIKLPELEFQYSDFVTYCEKRKGTSKYNKARKFWIDKLAILPENPMLPVHTKQANRGRIISEQQRKVISWDIWKNIETAASSHGLSTFILSFTAFCKAVAKYSKNQKFVINLPVSNRPQIHKDIDKIVGVCSNFFLFDFENSNQESLLETARRVQNQMWELKEHDCFNGNEIIREIYRESGEVGSFVATIVFTSLLDIPLPEKKNLKRVYLETHTSQIWMDTVMMADIDGITFNCDFVKDLLNKKLVDHMIGDCIMLLEKLAVDLNSWHNIYAIPLSKEDKKRWAANNNETMELPALSVMDSFLIHVQEKPEQPAIATSSQVLSYRETFDKVLCINSQLRELGINKGDAVAVVTNKAWYQVTAILGILSTGACYVPVDEAFPEKTLTYCMNTAEVKICLTDDQNESKVLNLEEVQVLNVESLSYEDSAKAEIAATSVQDILAVIFTSGTTGMPKGIRLKQIGVLNSVWFTNKKYHLAGEDKAIALTNICHDMSMYDMFGMLVAGGTIVIPEKGEAREPEKWMDLMRRFGVTIFNSVPAFAEMLFLNDAKEVKESLKKMRLVIHGGDFLKPSLARKLLDSNPNLKLINVGGPTETSLWSIYHEVTREDIEQEKIPYGRPIANMKHYILNDIQEEVPAHVMGTIYSEGIGLAEEYVGQPELTKEKFVKWKGRRVFITGDLGYYSETGEIIICGRDDNQIKINGKRIELEEIEKQVNHLEQIEAVCVIYHRQTKRLVAYYTGKQELEKNTLQTILKSNLPDYMIPSVWINLSKLPLTRNGKIDRKSLARQSLDAYLPTKPKTQKYEDSIEEELYQQAAKILGRSSIPKGANFFMEGGNSILAIQMLAFIRKNYAVSMGLGELFKNPCMNIWHDLIAERKMDVPSQSLDRKNIIKEKKIPLSSAQTGIWFYENAHKSAKYTVCAYTKLSGELDRASLEEVLCKLVKANAVFQLNYDVDDKGIPYQFINSHNAKKCIEFMDLEEEQEIWNLIQEKANYRFDIKTEQLCKFIIIRTSPKVHYLVMMLHHLIADEMTVEVLFQDIAEQYQKMDGKEIKPVTDYLQYCSQKSEVSIVKAYWKQQLGQIAIMEPGFTKTNSTKWNLSQEEREWEAYEESRIVEFIIKKETTEELKSICQENRSTMFSVLYSIYHATIYLYFGTPCVATVTTFTDRMRSEYTNAYGMFVYNELVIYQQELEDSFEQILEKINAQILKIYEMPFVSFNDIVREIGMSSDYLKLQNHMVFTYVDNDRADISLKNLTMEAVQIVKKVKDMNQDLLIEKVNGEYLGHLYYSPEFLSEVQAEEFIAAFKQIMENCKKNLRTPILNWYKGQNKEGGQKKVMQELEDDLF